MVDILNMVRHEGKLGKIIKSICQKEFLSFLSKVITNGFHSFNNPIRSQK